MELLEAEVRRWAVEWDVVGLAETWFDEECEKEVALKGYGGLWGSVCIKEGKGGGTRLGYV